MSITRIPFTFEGPDRYNLNAKMSKAVVHENTIYFAGITADDELVDAKADIEIQTSSALGILEKSLEELGSSKEKILSVTVVLKDMSDFGGMNKVWVQWFKDGNIKPARTTISAALADPNYKIELIVVAAK